MSNQNKNTHVKAFFLSTLLTSMVCFSTASLAQQESTEATLNKEQVTESKCGSTKEKKTISNLEESNESKINKTLLEKESKEAVETEEKQPEKSKTKCGG